MIVVDTSVLIAILQGEPEAEHFLEVLSGEPRCVLGAPTKFEALLVAAKRPNGQADLNAFIDELGIKVIDWTDDHASIASEAFLRFGKRRHKANLNFGDCMSYALAKSLNAPLLFKGDDFALTDITSAL